MDLNCRLVFSAVKIFHIILKIQCGRLYFSGKIYFPLNARFRKKGVAEKSDLAESVGVTDSLLYLLAPIPTTYNRVQLICPTQKVSCQIFKIYGYFSLVLIQKRFFCDFLQKKWISLYVASRL